MEAPSKICPSSSPLGRPDTQVMINKNVVRAISRACATHETAPLNDPFFQIFLFLEVKNPYDLRSQIGFWISPKKRTLSYHLRIPV